MRKMVIRVISISLCVMLVFGNIPVMASNDTITRYGDIYVDEIGYYYYPNNRHVQRVYLELIQIAGTNEKYIAQIAKTYDLPYEIVQELNLISQKLKPDETISLFIPLESLEESYGVRSQGERWGHTYNITYQGVTFKLKNYYIYLNSETSYTTVYGGDNTMAYAQNLISWSAFALGLLCTNPFVSTGISIASILISSGMDTTVQGATADRLQANIDYSATEKFTYVYNNSNWDLRFISSKVKINTIHWYFFRFNDDYRLYFDTDQYYTLYSPDYNNSDIKAICTLSTMRDYDIYVKIGDVLFYFM